MIPFIVLTSFDLVYFSLAVCLCVSVMDQPYCDSEDVPIPLYNKDTGWLMLTCVLP